jgi:hypothetical protein
LNARNSSSQRSQRRISTEGVRIFSNRRKILNRISMWKIFVVVFGSSALLNTGIAQTTIWVPVNPPSGGRACHTLSIAGPVRLSMNDGKQMILSSFTMNWLPTDDTRRMEFAEDEACSLIAFSSGDFWQREDAKPGKKPTIETFYPLSAVQSISYMRIKSKDGLVDKILCAIVARDPKVATIEGVQWCGWGWPSSITGYEDAGGFGKAKFETDLFQVREISFPDMPRVAVKKKSSLRASVLDVVGNRYSLSDVRLGQKSYKFTMESGSQLEIEIKDIAHLALGAADSSGIKRPCNVRLRSGAEKTLSFVMANDGIGGWDGQNYIFIEFDLVSQITLSPPTVSNK